PGWIDGGDLTVLIDSGLELVARYQGLSPGVEKIGESRVAADGPVGDAAVDRRSKLRLAIGELALLRELSAPNEVRFGGAGLRSVGQVAEQDARDRIARDRLRGRVLAQGLAIRTTRLRRLRLGELVIGERVGHARNGHQQQG